MHKYGFIIAALLLACSCTREDDAQQVAAEDPRIQELLKVPTSFPPIPFPEDNAFSLSRWELGQRIFFDPALSRDGSIACVSCHSPHLAFSDSVAFSLGVEHRIGVRNAPSLANVGYLPYFLRDGSVPNLERQVLVPIDDVNEFDHNIVLIVERLKKLPGYEEMSQAAYERPLDAFSVTRALATFQRTLISGNSTYDQAERGEIALDAEERLGQDLFFSDRTSCTTCHGSFLFTTGGLENNGLYAEYHDPGRYRLTLDSHDIGRMKVPSLRNVAYTAPYMHDGSLATLDEVVEHYNRGGAGHFNQHPAVRPLHLNAEEVKALVRFLETLSDESFVSNALYRPTQEP
jgi:cytochrome c peroxidase